MQRNMCRNMMWKQRNIPQHDSVLLHRCEPISPNALRSQSRGVNKAGCPYEVIPEDITDWFSQDFGKAGFRRHGIHHLIHQAK